MELYIHRTPTRIDSQRRYGCSGTQPHTCTTVAVYRAPHTLRLAMRMRSLHRPHNGSQRNAPSREGQDVQRCCSLRSSSSGVSDIQWLAANFVIPSPTGKALCTARGSGQPLAS